MKCERCGCEFEYCITGQPVAVCMVPGMLHHATESDCIAALKAKLDEKMTSEPTKLERFPTARKYVTQHSIGLFEDIIPDIEGLIAAYDEAKVLIVNYIYPDFIQWLKKWG